jgi:hypothetical protein
MRLRVVVAAVSGAVVVGVGVTFAAHVPEIDPATVPTGLVVAHNYVADVPVSRICAGGRAERRRRLRPALEPGPEPGVRMAHPLRTGGRDCPERVADLPGRRAERVPQSNLHGRSGIRGSRLRPRAPRDRGPSRAEIYSTFLRPPGRRTTSSRRPAGEVFVAGGRAMPTAMGAARAAPHRETSSRFLRTAVGRSNGLVHSTAGRAAMSSGDDLLSEEKGSLTRQIRQHSRSLCRDFVHRCDRVSPARLCRKTSGDVVMRRPYRRCVRNVSACSTSGQH